MATQAPTTRHIPENGVDNDDEHDNNNYERTLYKRYVTLTRLLMEDQIKQDKRDNELTMCVGPNEDAWDELMLLSELVSELGNETYKSIPDNSNKKNANDTNKKSSTDDTTTDNNATAATSTTNSVSNPTKEPLFVKDFVNDPVTCEIEFRFRPDELQHVADALWPKVCRLLRGNKRRIRVTNFLDEQQEQHKTVPYETGLLITLSYMSRPRRVSPEMERLFGYSESTLFNIIQTFLTALNDLAVLYLQNPAILHHRFQLYASKISDASNGALLTTWGFVDHAVRTTRCRTDEQHLAYSGHKKAHQVKCQSVVTPDGLIACLYGPYLRRWSECRVIGNSTILDQLEKLMPQDGPDTIYSLYTNLNIPFSGGIFGGFRNPPAESLEAAWKARMTSDVQEVIESAYTNVITQWSYIDYLAHNSDCASPLGMFFTVGALLCNLQSCLYGNQTSNYFDVHPSNGKLTMTEYLDLVKDDGTVNVKGTAGGLR